MDTPDHMKLEWRVLNDETQVASTNGRIVAIAYTVEAAESGGGTC